MAFASVKVVLKSTTTKTLNDRFSEMVHYKSPGSKRQNNREEMINTQRASAKNKRLAEQMSRRPGISSTAAMDKEGSPKKSRGNIRNRIDQSRVKSNVKDRLGVQNSPRGNRGGRGGRSMQSRLGLSARGGSTSRVAMNRRSNSPIKRGINRGNQTRGTGRRGGRGGAALRNETGRGQYRGRGRGRGGRGGSRGGRGGRSEGRRPTVNRNNLDTEIDSYMSEYK